MSIGPLGLNLSEILIKIHLFSFARMHLKILSGKLRLFCPGEELTLPEPLLPCKWCVYTLITRFMGPTWGPSGADRTQMGPILAPWTLPSGYIYDLSVRGRYSTMHRDQSSKLLCWMDKQYNSIKCLHYRDVISLFRHCALGWSIFTYHTEGAVSEHRFMEENPKWLYL